MKNIRVFLQKNIYVIYIVLITLISVVFGVFIKLKLDKLSNINLEIKKDIDTIYIGLAIFCILIIAISVSYLYYLRTNIISFSDRISYVIDKIMHKEEKINFDICEETITSKTENKLKQLLEIMQNEKIEYLREKDNIKTLISDISHQIKTPIANISMYNETLIERELNKEQQTLCLSNMKFQVDKLEWLVKCLIKMSRLETGVINLNKKQTKISEILADALAGVYIKAENKSINIDIQCDENSSINCDIKWTSEAVFNILENAVKYSKSGKDIKIFVEKLELFTKIDIIDNGIGIEESEINNIFKRFYRCREVSSKEGVGIGLYLAREIISKQGGYIKVRSKKGAGSMFSLYILND